MGFELTAKGQRRYCPQMDVQLRSKQMQQIYKDKGLMEGVSGMETQSEEAGFESVRCSGCGARLMDTDGKKVEYGGITVRIKCWRCKAVKLIWLRPDSAKGFSRA